MSNTINTAAVKQYEMAILKERYLYVTIKGELRVILKSIPPPFPAQ